MKRIAALLLVLLLAAALAVPALADVIWEPENDFYTEHRDECVYLDDVRYEAQTEVSVVRSPEDSEVLGTLPAGTVLDIDWLWTGEGEWGVVSPYLENEDWIEGWVDLADCRRLYGPAEFEAEHGAEALAADGELYITGEQELVLWRFPGSGEISGRFGGPDSWLEEQTVGFSRVWTDEDGNDWAEFPYFYGASGWAYLSDQDAGDLPRTAPYYADGGERSEDGFRTYAPAAPRYESRSAAAMGPVVSVVVIVLIAATVLLLVLPFGKKGGKK